MSALSHKGVQLIVGGWTFFIAENLILSENRDFLVGELGETTYRNLYGTLSTAACGCVRACVLARDSDMTPFNSHARPLGLRGLATTRA